MRTLRSKVIRLAHQNPALRPHLLPLLTGGRFAASQKVKGLSSSAQAGLTEWLSSGGKTYSAGDLSGKVTKNRDGGMTVTLPKVLSDWSYDDRGNSSSQVSQALIDFVSSQAKTRDLDGEYDVEWGDAGDSVVELTPKG